MRFFWQEDRDWGTFRPFGMLILSMNRAPGMEVGRHHPSRITMSRQAIDSFLWANLLIMLEHTCLYLTVFAAHWFILMQNPIEFNLFNSSRPALHLSYYALSTTFCPTVYQNMLGIGETCLDELASDLMLPGYTLKSRCLARNLCVGSERSADWSIDTMRSVISEMN